jgi:hypothetical protein
MPLSPNAHEKVGDPKQWDALADDEKVTLIPATPEEGTEGVQSSVQGSRMEMVPVVLSETASPQGVWLVSVSVAVKVQV